MWLGRKARRGALEADVQDLEATGVVAKRDYRAQRRKGQVKVGGIGARGQRKAFLKVAPKAATVEAPKEPPKPGRAPTRVLSLRKQAANAIDDVVQSVGRALVTKLEKREERRLAFAKIAAGRMLPPVPDLEKGVSRAIEALAAEDATRSAQVAASRKVVEEHERTRRLKLERIEAFEEAKRGVVEANRLLRDARKLVKDCKTQLYDVEHRRLDAESFEDESSPKRLTEAQRRDRDARNAYAFELAEQAAQKRAELVAANGEVERLDHALSAAKDGVARAAAGLEGAHVDLGDHVRKAEDEANMSVKQKRKITLKSKVLKAATLGSIMKASTRSIGEEGAELARRKSAVPEAFLAALDGALTLAGPRLADYLGQDGLNKLGPAHRLSVAYVVPRLKEEKAAVIMQKSTRALGHARAYAKVALNRNAAKAIQKTARALRHFKATTNVGYSAKVFHLAERELGAAAAAAVAEFVKLPVQSMASTMPAGKSADAERALAIQAALLGHAFSEELAVHLAVPLADELLRRLTQLTWAEELDEDLTRAVVAQFGALRAVFPRPKACHAALSHKFSIRRLFAKGLACACPRVRRAAACCLLACARNLDHLSWDDAALSTAEAASSQAVALDACDVALAPLVKAMTKCTDPNLVDAGLDVMRHAIDARGGPRVKALVDAGAGRYAASFLMRLAFEQFLAGPNTVDEDRDDFARKGAAVLLACYDDAAGRLAARADDLHVYAAASLLGCTGWILGQQLGCVCCGVLGGHDDVKRDLAPLIPKLSRLLNEVQASPEINLAAKLALDAMCSVGAAGAFDADSHFLATHLDDAGLLGVLARDPERDEREIFRVPTEKDLDAEDPYAFPNDFYGIPDLLPPADVTEAGAPDKAPPKPPSAPTSARSRGDASVASAAERSVASQRSASVESGFDSNSVYSS